MVVAIGGDFLDKYILVDCCVNADVELWKVALFNLLENLVLVHYFVVLHLVEYGRHLIKNKLNFSTKSNHWIDKISLI